MMGPDCIIYTQNHQFSNLDIPMCKQGFDIPFPVYIDDDVWIGGRVIILPGVHVMGGQLLELVRWSQKMCLNLALLVVIQQGYLK